MDVPAVVEESVAIPLVSQENIDRAQNDVARTMKFHWFLRGVKVVGGLGFVGFLGYYYLFRNSGGVKLPEVSEEKGKEASEVLKRISEKMQEKPLSLEGLDKRLKEVESVVGAVKKAVLPPRTWGKWFVKSLSGNIKWLAFGGVTMIGQKIWNISSHDDDMKWYAQQKTRVYQQIRLLRYYSQKLRKTKELTDSEQEIYYKTSLVAFCKSIVVQVEKLCGFMQYSLQQFENRGAFLKSNETLQVPYLIAATNKVVVFFQKKFPVGVEVSLSDLQDGYAQLISFVNDLEKHIEAFIEIEHNVEDRLGDV